VERQIEKKEREEANTKELQLKQREIDREGTTVTLHCNICQEGGAYMKERLEKKEKKKRWVVGVVVYIMCVFKITFHSSSQLPNISH